MGTDFLCQVKCPIVQLNKDLRVHLDLHALDFHKSTSQYFFFLPKQLESMDIGASQQCVTFGCNVVLMNYFELLNNINFSKIIYCTYYWLIFSFFFLQNGFACYLFQKIIQNTLSWTKKCQGVKSTYRYFLENTAHASPNISLNLYQDNIWCTLL